MIYDEFELFEFFESEPLTIGDHAAGNWLYSIVKDEFILEMYVSIYEEYVEISIAYKYYTVCEQIIDNVIELKKSDDIFRIITKNGRNYCLKKDVQLGYYIEQ